MTRLPWPPRLPKNAKVPVRPRDLRAAGRYVRAMRPSREESLDAPWSGPSSGVATRRYGSYDDYVEHQASKLETVFWLDEYDRKYREALRERLETGGYVRGGESVLCLAARVGTEVKAFRDCGCFAVGTDLNPGEVNPFVLLGDFHDVQLPDGCVDVVFTNSIDHSPTPERLIGEMARVVKGEGRMIVEVAAGRGEGEGPKYYEAASWARADDLLPFFEEVGFACVHRSHFEYPWTGWHWVLERPRGGG